MGSSTFLAPGHGDGSWTYIYSLLQEKPADSPNRLKEGTSDESEAEFNYESGIRKECERKGFSTKSCEILLKNWRLNTQKTYKSIIKDWFSFAFVNDYCLFNPSIGEGLNYITYLFDKGVSFNRLCTIRAALSAFIFVNIDFGNHSMVKKYFKGLFNLNPSFTVKSKIANWDANIVLSLLKDWYPYDDLSLKQISLKLAFLLAILSGQRVQTICNILISNIVFEEDKCIIFFTNLLKHTRKGFQQEPITLLKFTNLNLCVVNLIKVYLEKTKTIRNGTDKLLLSFQKPHKAISTETLSRWLKLIISLSGIDIKSKNIKAHSTRSQATSIAAWTGMSVTTIMKAAGWSRQTTFTKFYKKRITENLGQAVLER